MRLNTPLPYDLHIQSHFYLIHQLVMLPLTSSSFNLKWWSLYKFNNHINFGDRGMQL